MSADLSFPNQDGVSRSISDIPPSHYTLKIQLFSQLGKNKIDKYTSTDFQAGGYKWKLVVHPNGNKNKGITDHVSLYLLMVSPLGTTGSNSQLPPGWEVRALFRLFLLDQNNDTYLTLQDNTADQKGRRFHGMKQEWGFDKFIPHTTFNDDANGYLVNDTCIFGAEVYVCQEKHTTGKGECLSMIKDSPITYKNTWRIDNFNSLTSNTDQECVDSPILNAADHKWKMQLYPRGKGSGTGSHISIYLSLAEPEKIPPATKIYAEFTIRILDQLNRNNDFGTANYWFSATNTTCGWPRFVSHAYFNLSTTGLLVKNVCLVEAEVTVHGVSDVL